MELDTLFKKIGQRFEYKKSLTQWLQEFGCDYAPFKHLLDATPAMGFETKRWAYECFRTLLGNTTSGEGARLLAAVRRAVGIEGDDDYHFDVASYRMAEHIKSIYPPFANECDTSVDTTELTRLNSIVPYLSMCTDCENPVTYTSSQPNTQGTGTRESYSGDVPPGTVNFYMDRDSYGKISYLEVGGYGYELGDTVVIKGDLIGGISPQNDLVIPITYNSFAQFGAWEGCSFSEFPEINTSNVRNFNRAWAGCTDLENFPEIDTSLGETFNGTWQSCGSLPSFPELDVSSGKEFNHTWGYCYSLADFPLLDFSSARSLSWTWTGCSGLISFPNIDTSNVSIFISTWQECYGLTEFPSLNTGNGKNFSGTWSYCYSLVAFPEIDTSNGELFTSAWYGCSGLEEFPQLNMAKGTELEGAWYGCSSLVSFPALNFNPKASFNAAWYGCSSLETFPPHMFDYSASTSPYAFHWAWHDCALSEESVDNILVSLDASGLTNLFTSLAGGTSAPPGAAGLAALASLQTKGWSVYTN